MDTGGAWPRQKLFEGVGIPAEEAKRMAAKATPKGRPLA